MDDKATAQKTWAPKVGETHGVDAWIDLDGTAVLWIDNELQFVTDRPEGGKSGPWPWDLMLQLGGPAGKAAGHKFEDVVFEVKEDA